VEEVVAEVETEYREVEVEVELAVCRQTLFRHTAMPTSSIAVYLPELH
jgi:hypothetical protein